MATFSSLPTELVAEILSNLKPQADNTENDNESSKAWIETDDYDYCYGSEESDDVLWVRDKVHKETNLKLLRNLATCASVNSIFCALVRSHIWNSSGLSRDQRQRIVVWAVIKNNLSALRRALESETSPMFFIHSIYDGLSWWQSDPRIHLGHIKKHLYRNVTSILEPESEASRDTNYWTPLHVAAYLGYDEAADLLLKHGASIDAPSSHFCSDWMVSWTVYYWTPLLVSMCGGKETMTKKLIRQGASLVLGKEMGTSQKTVTAFDYAYRQGLPSIMKFIVEGGY